LTFHSRRETKKLKNGKKKKKPLKIDETGKSDPSTTWKSAARSNAG
jgi:hypothetical protein